MSEHYLIRFNHGRKVKRKYHINEISSIVSNFSDFSITVNFDSTHSLVSKVKQEEGEERVFYFQSLNETQMFSYELQKSIITCNKKKENPTQVLGDSLPQNDIKTLNQLRDKVMERGIKLQNAADASERLHANAKTFSENARLLKEQYQNSIWTSSSLTRNDSK